MAGVSDFRLSGLGTMGDPTNLELRSGRNALMLPVEVLRSIVWRITRSQQHPAFPHSKQLLLKAMPVVILRRSLRKSPR